MATPENFENGLENDLTGTKNSEKVVEPKYILDIERLEIIDQFGNIEKVTDRPLRNQNRKNDVDSAFSPRIKYDFTTFTHFCIVLYVTLIVYLCFWQTFEFFFWHPLLFSIGWMLLMTEGILLISNDNPIVQRLRLNHTLQLRFHWIALTISMILVIIGLMVVVVNKFNKNKFHFKTWHAIFGLVSLISCVPAVLTGIAALFGVELKQYIKPSLNKAMHLVCGELTVFCGGVTLVLGLYSAWFGKFSEHNTYLFLLGFITATYVTIWTVQRPLLRTLKDIFKFFRQ